MHGLTDYPHPRIFATQIKLPQRRRIARHANAGDRRELHIAHGNQRGAEHRCNGRRRRDVVDHPRPQVLKLSIHAVGQIDIGVVGIGRFLAELRERARQPQRMWHAGKVVKPAIRPQRDRMLAIRGGLQQRRVARPVFGAADDVHDLGHGVVMHRPIQQTRLAFATDIRRRNIRERIQIHRAQIAHHRVACLAR